MTQFKKNEKWCQIHNCRYKIDNRKIKSLSLQPKSRFSRLRQTKKILSDVLKDREIIKRQLNVFQNGAPIDYGVALKDQYSIM